MLVLKAIGETSLIDTLTVFFVAAAVIIIGLLANILFKKTGWPEILFLIFTGIVVGPVTNVFLKSDLLPILPMVSTFTLLMVLFRGGLELNLSEIAAGSFRSIVQTLAYFAAGTNVVTSVSSFMYKHKKSRMETVDSSTIIPVRRQEHRNLLEKNV